MPGMPDLTDDMIIRLEEVGVQHPAEVPWRMMKRDVDAEIVHPEVCFAEYICWCWGEPKRITMVPFEGRKFPIRIGQCSVCRIVRWRFADRRTVWKGPTHLEAARPMYPNSGRC